MRRILFTLAILTLPVAAWSLTTAANRSAASGDYLVAVDLTTQFGRMGAGGDYLPQEPDGSGGGTITYGAGGVHGKSPALGHHRR